MKSNNRLLFVGFLILFFPIIFIYISQGFFTAAYSNIETSDKKVIAALHESISFLLQEDEASLSSIQTFIEKQQAVIDGVEDIRIVREQPEGLVVVATTKPNVLGTTEGDEVFYRTALADTTRSFIFATIEGGGRVWYAVRAIPLSSGSRFYIASEHSYNVADSVMAKRQQQSYFGLSIIFVFLLLLAYWLAKQTDWQRRFEQAEKNMKERDLFVNMIAHEFRTPLTAINGYTSFLLESKTITQEERRYATTIQQSTERLIALVNDFLEVARIQSGNMQIEKKPIDIQPVITSVVDTLRQSATKKELVLVYTPLQVPIVLATDTKRLYQILQNVISNAIKYTEKGTITITTDMTPSLVTVRVQDTGMGISAEDQQKLFAPFARVGGVEKTSITGTGLGMWITKQITEILGGTISIESIKQVGTHVVITFKR